MPTIFSHALLPIAAGSVLGKSRLPQRVAFLGAALAVLPDFDVIGFSLGIGYESQWGHRGFTHSLAFAVLLPALIALCWKTARSWGAYAFLVACLISHALLDLLTDGGQGVMLFWPFLDDRFFLNWQPIRVSPIGARFFTARGVETVYSELLLIWLPALSAVGLASAYRRRNRKMSTREARK